MSDTEISFQSGDVTLYGSLRLAASPDAPAPAALILAYSGPTDRNGDSALLEGDIGTLRFIADLLEKQGISSLRYDKLGSGETALGDYDIEDIADLGFNTLSTPPPTDWTTSPGNPVSIPSACSWSDTATAP